MDKRLKKLSIITIGVAFFTLTISASHRNDFGAGKNLEILFNIYKSVNLMYVDSVDNDKILKKASNALLSSLDPYTEYYTESDMKEFKFATTRQYGGVGSLIRKKDSDEYGIIESTYRGSPMDNAGVRGGDTIISVDGIDMRNGSNGDLSEKMKGTPNTIVKMRIKSMITGETKDYEIERKIIKLSPIAYSGLINDSIGYISFNSFSLESALYVKDALLELKKNKNLKGLILDLRDNGGGVIGEAVDIVGLFVPVKTEVVETKARQSGQSSTHVTRHAPIDTELPLTVLINRSSASASEIVSGALQDFDRAVIIGNRSFGKGLVQTTKEVGYGSFIKITTAKYYIPSGRCIQARDYSNVNDDGSVGHISDSLITEFSTNAGRKVYDGGGIMPDVIVEPNFRSIFSLSIYARGYIDDFSLDYYKRNRKIPSLDFSLPEEEYNLFLDYLADKKIEFSSKSEGNLDKLIESAKKEKIYDDIDEYVKEIEAILTHKDREKSFNDNKDQIIELLEGSIVGRYHYQEGRAEKFAKNDSTVHKAIEILNNKVEYNDILKNRSTKKK